ncbi:MAG: MFS transporter [Chitinophagaceae bacterium]|nr:MFS transporter [Chitinophagaceae bacterium]
MKKDTSSIPYSSYQKFVILIIALTQFSVVLDFMVMSPLGDMMMKSMNLTPSQFGLAVSAYAISAGLSGLLTAGFADRFDRKKLYLFFYLGFIAGTFLCGMVHTYPQLIAARIFTGLFGGVIGSIAMAIITDLFDLHHRGRVMGFIQMGFGASQVLGIPISLYIANHWGWQMPFMMVGALGIVIAVLILSKMKPVSHHLSLQTDKNAFLHLWHTVAKRKYRIAFLTTALLSIGGFMMMPFGSAFAINNLKLTNEQLPMLFMVSGIASLVIMPLIGKVSDKIDKFRVFTIATTWMCIMVVIYTNLGPSALWLVILLNVLMMSGVMARIIPSSALVSAVPAMADRGAFMSINASLQQIAGGIAAAFAGIIVVQPDKSSPLQHYNTLGYIIVAISVLSMYMLFRVSAMEKDALKEQKL